MRDTRERAWRTLPFRERSVWACFRFFFFFFLSRHRSFSCNNISCCVNDGPVLSHRLDFKPMHMYLFDTSAKVGIASKPSHEGVHHWCVFVCVKRNKHQKHLPTIVCLNQLVKFSLVCENPFDCLSVCPLAYFFFNCQFQKQTYDSNKKKQKAIQSFGIVFEIRRSGGLTGCSGSRWTSKAVCSSKRWPFLARVVDFWLWEIVRYSRWTSRSELRS